MTFVVVLVRSRWYWRADPTFLQVIHIANEDRLLLWLGRDRVFLSLGNATGLIATGSYRREIEQVHVFVEGERCAQRFQ